MHEQRLPKALLNHEQRERTQQFVKRVTAAGQLKDDAAEYTLG